MLYGDVYCAERLVRFGLGDSDRCRRCFAKETIMHLLTECPFTLKVYSLLRINCDDIEDILGVNLNKAALEIRCDLIGYIVFRQHTMPPEVLVKTTLEKYVNGLVNNSKIINTAERLLRQAFRNDPRA